MEDIKIGGAKVSPLLLIAAGAGVLLVVVKGSGAGGSATIDRSGLLSTEFSQQLNQAAAAQSVEVANAKADLQSQLATNRNEMQNQLTLAQAQAELELNAIQAQQAAGQQDLSGQLQGIQASQVSLLQKLIDAIGKLGSAPVGATAPPPAATGAGAGIGKVNVDPNPSQSRIQEWANGIGLPVEWAQAFVHANGGLPKELTDWHTWADIVMTHEGGTVGCIAGKCI